MQQETGDYPAAAASHQQALALFADLGNRLGQAEALNRLGELATRTADTPQARERHAQALAIARDLGAPLEEARALEGLGQSHLQDASPSQAAVHLRQALAIYQRIGAPAARRVQQDPPKPEAHLHHTPSASQRHPKQRRPQLTSAPFAPTKPLTGSRPGDMRRRGNGTEQLIGVPHTRWLRLHEPPNKAGRRAFYPNFSRAVSAWHER